MNLTVLFIVLSVVNVILSTVRSLATIKCGKTIASFVNAIYYGYYTIVAIYTVTLDFSIWVKVAITFGCNLFGVFIVKLIEEKMRKDKLWKIEMTLHTNATETVDRELTELKVPHCYVTISPKHTKFECYCATKKDTDFVTEIGRRHNARFFASASEKLM